MPEFTYTARDQSGQQVAGSISATSHHDALGMLNERSLFPLNVAEQQTRRSSFAMKKRISSELLSTTLGQLADLLNSGVPLLRSLDVLASQASHPRLESVLADVRGRVAEGATLDAALGKHVDVFGELTVSMVRAGGEGGFLEDVLERTAEFIEHQQELKSRVVGAATYPAILAAAGTIAVVVLIVFFVPKFEPLFARLEERGELPALTTAMLWTSHAAGQYGIFVVAVLAGVAVWAGRQAKTESGRRFIDKLKLKVPAIGGIYLSLAVSRFCRVLGTLLRNGVPILRSLEISSDSTGNKILAVAIRKAGENISAGESLAVPLSQSGLFPRTVVEMIRVAEESNNLENVLIKIADGVERRTERQLDLIVRLLEPFMLLIMAVVILLVVIALLLPVIQMSTAIS
jgi:general secretion pathway protein F/type IV pilus assembly protein PilC